MIGLTLAALGLSVHQLFGLRAFGITMLEGQYLYIIGGLLLALTFLFFRARPGAALRWHDWLLAGLSLVVVTLWLYRQGRPWLYTAVPMLVVLSVSFLALWIMVGGFLRQGNLLLAAVGALMLALEAWVVIEGAAAWRRLRATAAEARAAAGA